MTEKEGMSVIWSNNSLSPPRGEPKCGWDGERCENGKWIYTLII